MSRATYASPVLAAGLLVVLTAGCRQEPLRATSAPTAELPAGAQIRLVDCWCERVEEAGRLAALTFVARIQTRGFTDKQLLYEVLLLNCDDEPISSRDGRFELDGCVAARRTFMVLLDPQEFERLTVTIPAEDLEFTQEDIPVSAEFGVFLVSGSCLARDSREVPVYLATELAR